MIEFIENKIWGYPARTEENVVNSDFTLAIATDFETAGERLTKNLCKKYKKPYIGASLYKANGVDFCTQIICNNKDLKLAKIINVAGNGLYTLKSYYHSQEEVDSFVYEILRNFKSCGFSFTTICSGGQTGVDEAALKAAEKLRLKAICRAPKGWCFRDINGNDISNEQAFKDRFNNH